MEVLLNLQNKNVTLNAVHVAPEGTNCCNRLKVHFDVFQETAKKAAIIRLSTANSFELIHYQDKHIALLIPFDRSSLATLPGLPLNFAFIGSPSTVITQS